jgi:hypothetical protein
MPKMIDTIASADKAIGDVLPGHRVPLKSSSKEINAATAFEVRYDEFEKYLHFNASQSKHTNNEIVLLQKSMLYSRMCRRIECWVSALAEDVGMGAIRCTGQHQGKLVVRTAEL